MNISASLQESINKQIQLELSSMYAYYGMAAWFETTPYKGFASWMRKQSEEEKEHADRFFDYLNERGGSVTLLGLPEPKATYDAPIDAFKASLEHEQKVTASIYAMYAQAQSEGDFATLEFLNWFLKEQVEEESSVQDMIDRLEMAAGYPGAMMQLDRLAATRED